MRREEMEMERRKQESERKLAVDEMDLLKTSVGKQTLLREQQEDTVRKLANEKRDLMAR
jgi:hypothetical protein